MALNITSKQTTIKLGPHKGKDMYVMEGHIVKIPGLGNIRAEVRAKAQSKSEDVTESDIIRRKLLLTPTKEIKDALNATPVRITCCDMEGSEEK